MEDERGKGTIVIDDVLYTMDNDLEESMPANDGRLIERSCGWGGLAEVTTAGANVRVANLCQDPRDSAAWVIFDFGIPQISNGSAPFFGPSWCGRATHAFSYTALREVATHNLSIDCWRGAAQPLSLVLGDIVSVTSLCV